jgi:hypothetical protein
MSKAQLVITAVVLEGRSKSEVARDYDVSRHGYSSCANVTTPRARRPISRAPGARTATPGRSAPRSKNTSCGYAKP